MYREVEEGRRSYRELEDNGIDYLFPLYPCPQGDVLPKLLSELLNSQISPKAIVLTPLLPNSLTPKTTPELPNIPPFDAQSGSSDADDATVMWLRQLPLTAPRASRSSSMAMRLSQ